jgi:hypothetical protein
MVFKKRKRFFAFFLFFFLPFRSGSGSVFLQRLTSVRLCSVVRFWWWFGFAFAVVRFGRFGLLLGGGGRFGSAVRFGRSVDGSPLCGARFSPPAAKSAPPEDFLFLSWIGFFWNGMKISIK